MSTCDLDFNQELNTKVTFRKFICALLLLTEWKNTKTDAIIENFLEGIIPLRYWHMHSKKKNHEWQCIENRTR